MVRREGGVRMRSLIPSRGTEVAVTLDERPLSLLPLIKLYFEVCALGKPSVNHWSIIHSFWLGSVNS